MTTKQPQNAEFMFEGLQALQHVDIPSAFDAARHAIYSYQPSFGDLSALPVAMSAPNFPKWAKTAKDTFQANAGDKLPTRVAKTALDTGGQVLRDVEGWGNPIADGMSATYRNVRGVYDKQKELGRKLTPREVLQESGKAALQTAKAQVVTRPKFYFYDAPKMGVDAVKSAAPKIGGALSKLRSILPTRKGAPQLASMSTSFRHFKNF
jgi:hypothetical protein